MIGDTHGNSTGFVESKRDLVNTVASRLSEMDGVSEVYSVAGRYDLAVIIRVKDNEELARSH